MPLSLAKFDAIASTLVHLQLFPSLLPPFVTLLLSPDLLFRQAEKTGRSEGRVMNQRELVGSNTGCVFVQDLVVLYIIIVESVDSYY